MKATIYFRRMNFQENPEKQNHVQVWTSDMEDWTDAMLPPEERTAPYEIITPADFDKLVALNDKLQFANIYDASSGDSPADSGPDKDEQTPPTCSICYGLLRPTWLLLSLRWMAG